MIYILLNLVPILAATLLGLALGYGHHRLWGGDARTPGAGLIAAAVVFGVREPDRVGGTRGERQAQPAVAPGLALEKASA